MKIHMACRVQKNLDQIVPYLIPVDLRIAESTLDVAKRE